MERAINKHYFKYSSYTDTVLEICVKCPKCNGFGIVTVDNNTAYFKCRNCRSFKTK